MVAESLHPLRQHEGFVAPLHVIHPKNDWPLAGGAAQKSDQQRQALVRGLELHAQREVAEARLVLLMQEVAECAELKRVLNAVALKLLSDPVLELLAVETCGVQITIERSGEPRL